MKNQRITNGETGSFLLEALLSLFVWMMIFSAFIPSFMFLFEKREELQYIGRAIQIVNEQYLKWIVNESIDRDIYFQGLRFHIEVGETDNHEKKICVHYEWKERVEKFVCRTIVQKQ